MNTLLVPAEHTTVSMKIQSADNTFIGSPGERQKGKSYEHEGYQIRVYFNGDKTLMQCICNLAERRIGS